MAKGKKATAVNPKGGRPPTEVDEDLIFGLAKLHHPRTEIASLCGISVDTLSRRFADLVEKGYNEGRRSLRQVQWSMALKGNVTMAIFLGKQILGQRDRFDDESSPCSFTVNVNDLPK